MHVYDDRIVHTVVPLAEAPEVSGWPAALMVPLDALSPRGAPRHDQPQGLRLQPRHRTRVEPQDALTDL